MMVRALSEFLAQKGVETMTLPEYKELGSEVPVKDFLLRRAFGSWTRVLSVTNKRYPVQVVAPKVEEVTAPKPKATKKGEK